MTMHEPLLRPYARILSVRGQELGPDLTPLRAMFGDRNRLPRIIAFLATEVEALSDNHLTVRAADAALFDNRLRGTFAYLAVCLVTTPDEVIVELDDSMTLYLLGPYPTGLTKGRPATPAAVEATRRQRLKDARRLDADAAGKSTIKALLATLYQRIVALIPDHPDPEIRELLIAYTRNGVTFFKLEDAAGACVIAGLDFKQLMKDAFQTI